jgi:hypothetical protein
MYLESCEMKCEGGRRTRKALCHVSNPFDHVQFFSLGFISFASFRKLELGSEYLLDFVKFPYRAISFSSSFIAWFNLI